MRRQAMLISILLFGMVEKSGAGRITGFGPENPIVTPPVGTPATIAQCISSAARIYEVSEGLLYAIGMNESRMNPQALHYNKKSNTEDIGLMQINSRWLPTLEKNGISREDLFDPCVSIHVGAWVLRGNMIRYGRTWRAVGAYNASSKRPDLRKKYVLGIKETLKKYGLLEADT